MVYILQYRVAEWIRKHDPHICCLQEIHLRTKDLHRLKVKALKKYSMQTDKKKKAGIAIPISDKTDFKKKRPLNTQEITSQHSKEESIKKS